MRTHMYCLELLFKDVPAKEKSYLWMGDMGTEGGNSQAALNEAASHVWPASLLRTDTLTLAQTPTNLPR